MTTINQPVHADVTGWTVADGKVLPEWIDANKHMNVAYYVLAFDHGVDALWERLGITADYIATTRCSTFAAECHITYQMELTEDEPYLVTSQVLAFDEKRIHQFQRLYQAQKKSLAATAEWMNLHVDLRSRRVKPFPPSILAALENLSRQQGVLPRPREAGHVMRIKKPLYSGPDS